ncbi:hypothetical protein GQ55_2G213400 [Panicum hallii var. hallii]|uniref:Uncharacterized protein n=1 Tax=Panicum hallii var. hallii TaxID=1504633 RepID=A0A2T7ER09_9POAL|nr:hypothetical protein GQ55_2G213400 [Panicum hallii var. hallii]
MDCAISRASGSGSGSRRRSAGVFRAGSATATESGGHGIWGGGCGGWKGIGRSRRGETTVVFFSSFWTVGPSYVKEGLLHFFLSNKS